MPPRSFIQARALSVGPFTFQNSARRQVRLASSLTSAYQLHPTKKDESGTLLSRVSGPIDKPLCELSLGEFWEKAATNYADRPALISKHEPATQHAKSSSESSDCIRWSYGAMNEHVQSLVAGLHELGVRKGDRVAVLMMNCSAYGALQWACAQIGAVLVTLNPAYSTSELRRAINLVEATSLFMVPSLRGTNYLDSLLELLPSLSSKASTSGDPTILQDESLPSLKRIVMLDNLDNRPRHWESNSVLAQQGKDFGHAMSALNHRAIDYRELLLSSSKANVTPEVLNTDVINLQLTSGTTGKPKAVALTSRNLLNNGIAIGDNLRFTEIDKLCNIPPLFRE
ncbi:hypothetical protein PHSY_005986 [Pseudozyma hubeiensis SY62]|uniref:AMP-dependent synthetase/ligase domain-containing protein n=1 Tax=Pseudozyma hubeiensis (strain SY62) TaxID=1305764 RepID=R9PAZ5_PSEHS|nr:hypothetical protein PHSY_005986 [Pseudozyma hubeiensis SY62]GAC98392.1 hypothetical protein PHSY_005986 [Pseudozyma hubeiensis SY62]